MSRPTASNRARPATVLPATVLTAMVLAAVVTLPALADAKPFRQGSLRPSVSLGGDSSGVGAGIGAAYCLVDGLELEAAVFHWFGSPSFTRITPGVRYVFIQVPTAHPYIGAFYRRQIVHDDDYEGGDFVGGRAGAFVAIGKRTYLGAGLGYERRLSCDDDADLDGDGESGDCDGFFPELSFTVSF